MGRENLGLFTTLIAIREQEIMQLTFSAFLIITKAHEKFAVRDLD